MSNPQTQQAIYKHTVKAKNNIRFVNKDVRTITSPSTQERNQQRRQNKKHLKFIDKTANPKARQKTKTQQPDQ